uniref:Uncharacterized protein n=1 Tax=Globisporangium ultimum (strain ATCC 200006 / CBS 805.95 / DAOM BR144) TaxID=431595 RepID=K3X8R1_GLOUD
MAASNTASTTTMMKEYLKKQLKYWVENFRDDMLPRDFNNVKFSRQQITLHKIELKLHKVAATLQIPKPLLVTRAYCSEVVIRVPSWTHAEKFVQEPLSFKIVDLFLDIKNAYDCDDEYRKAAEARAQAAIMEPDPLGSIASWCAFSTIINERLELLVDNIYIKVFAKGVSRIRIELTNFHSRTTNTMWQDMRDLTGCVDRSPDGLLKTRFKFVSCGCSILLQAENASNNEPSGVNVTLPASPLKLLHDHAVSMRMTLFGHRRSKAESWETLSQVIDVNFHTTPLEFELTELLQIYQMYTTIYGWIQDAKDQERKAELSGAELSSSSILLHHHQIQRGATVERKKTKENGGEGDDAKADEASFALQLTFRFAIDAKLHFTSERLGKQLLHVSARHIAINWIVHHDHVRELQVTAHEVVVKFHDEIVLYLKPDRDVMQLKQLGESVLVKWHLQTLKCHIENDLALILNEAYHAQNEKEQSVFIKCGTCLQQIRLESIETHVCGPTRSPASSIANSSRQSRASSTATVPHSRHTSHADESIGSEANSDDITDQVEIVKKATVPKLRLVLALDELEVTLDNHLFHTVQQLLRSSGSTMQGEQLAERRFRVTMQEFRVTTESKEFVGDAIFVPVLPLAFQMLECTIQGCGCIQKVTSTATRGTAKAPGDTHRTELLRKNCAVYRNASWWPDRAVVEIKHVACKATSLKDQQQPTAESFLTADAINVQSSFSDGKRVCVNCHPQLSVHASVDRVRCQVHDPIFQYVAKLWSDYRGGEKFTVSQTLFLAVLEIRAVEFTLLESQLTSIGGGTNMARMKNLFKFVSLVIDNQLGHLSLQSSLDFRVLYNSHRLRFFHRQRGTLPKAQAADGDGHERSDHGQAVEVQATTVDEEKESSSPDRPLTKQQRRRLRQDSKRAHAARVIQQNVRHHVLAQSQPRCITPHSPVSSQADALLRSDNDGGVVFDERIRSDSNSNEKHSDLRLGPHDDRITSESQPKCKDSSSTSSNSSLFGHVPEDLMSPKKMVAAANVLTNFVKAKQQQLESEVAGLATQSKESAARLVMPSYTACKKLFRLDGNGNDKQELRRESSSSGRKRGVDSVGESETRAARTASESSSSSSLILGDATEAMVETSSGDGNDHSCHQEHVPVSNDREEQQEEESNAAASNSAGSDQVDDQEVATETNCNDRATGGDRTEADDQEDNTIPGSVDELQPSEFGLHEELLAKLPDVLRVLVQIDEYRLRVPINPREKVAFLCREIVRRFNELFVDHTSQKLAHVTLQDARGGVFASTDIVGFVYRCEDEVLFAVPYQVGEQIRCVAHLEPSSRSSSSSSCVSVSKTPRSSSNKTMLPKGRLGTMFSRCSELPLPLVIALLANEKERDLLQCMINASGGNGHEWPELALNASFLDPTTRQMLHVQVCWFENACVRVADPDAFVLCLQQLGLCTSSSSRGSNSSSKYVGKILRDRLKMDASNPLIHAACLRSPEFRQQQRDGKVGGDKELETEGEKDAARICYESLKAIVQEDYGVFLQPAE